MTKKPDQGMNFVQDRIRELEASLKDLGEEKDRVEWSLGEKKAWLQESNTKSVNTMLSNRFHGLLRQKLKTKKSF